jgi:hypothetical protein
MADFVTSAGLRIKTVQEILDELEAREKAEIDATLNTAADSPVGQLNGIFAAQLREAWEILQVAHNGFNPDAAEGLLLEKLSALTGTLREGATKSTVTLSCDLDAATTLLAGTHYANVVGNPDSRWTPSADYTASGPGAQDVEFEAEFAGAVSANAGTITEINTPVVGWNSVTNAADAAIGREIDTDAILRQRREEELRATGTATLDAIRADVVADPLVQQCSVFENVSDVVDINGLPPRSIEVVVFDGDPPALTDDQVAQLIFDSKPAGMLVFGLSSGTATDSLGSQHTIGFSRPTERQLYLEIGVAIDSVTGYAGEAALKEALVDLNESYFFQGRDVIGKLFVQTAMAFDGIWNIGNPKFDFVASPTNENDIVVGPREIVRLDTSRITILEFVGPIP